MQHLRVRSRSRSSPALLPSPSPNISPRFIDSPLPGTSVRILSPESRPLFAPRTQELLQSIREHLIRESSITRRHYESIVKVMHPLVGGDSDYPEPDDGTVRDYFSQDFPDIQVEDWENDLNTRQLQWGAVSKKPGNQDNKIHLRGSVVWALEMASEETRSQLSLILLVVVIHELSHALTKRLFDGTVTPYSATPEGITLLGWDPRNDTNPYQAWNGESGDIIEEGLFGFRLLVEWETIDRGKMGKIRRLIARGEDGGTRELTVQNANDIIESLREDELFKIAYSELKPAPEDAERHVRYRADSYERVPIVRSPIPVFLSTGFRLDLRL